MARAVESRALKLGPRRVDAGRMDPGERVLPATPAELDHARRMRRKRRVAIGTTVVLIGLVTAMAIPNWLASNRNANESAAIATLKNLSSAQAQIQAIGIIDPNGNGQGGYGFFSEMAGTMAVRSKPGAEPVRCSPPVVSASFGSPENGRVHRGGYVFEMLLPAADGGWATEHDFVNGRKLDESKCETLWLCYAWPESYDWSGKRAFMLNQSGDVLVSRNADGKFDGERGPRPGVSAFLEPVQGAKVAANCEDCEGETWGVV